MPPANKPNLVVKALSSRPYRRGGIWPSRQRQTARSDSKRHGMRPCPLYTGDSPSPKNGMGIMTTSPRATLFRGDEAQGRRSRVPLDTRVGGRYGSKSRGELGRGSWLNESAGRSRMRLVACRAGVLSISRGQVEVQGATGDGMWVLRVWRKVRVERGEEMHVVEGLIGRPNFEGSSNKEARERGERPRRE